MSEARRWLLSAVRGGLARKQPCPPRAGDKVAVLSASSGTAVASGTSLAAAMVAGAAFGVWNEYSRLSATDIKSALVASGSLKPSKQGLTIADGAAILNVAQAMRNAAGAAGTEWPVAEPPAGPPSPRPSPGGGGRDRGKGKGGRGRDGTPRYAF